MDTSIFIGNIDATQISYIPINGLSLEDQAIAQRAVKMRITNFGHFGGAADEGLIADLRFAGTEATVDGIPLNAYVTSIGNPNTNLGTSIVSGQVFLTNYFGAWAISAVGKLANTTITVQDGTQFNVGEKIVVTNVLEDTKTSAAFALLTVNRTYTIQSILANVITCVESTLTGYRDILGDGYGRAVCYPLKQFSAGTQLVEKSVALGSQPVSALKILVGTLATAFAGEVEIRVEKIQAKTTSLYVRG